MQKQEFILKANKSLLKKVDNLARRFWSFVRGRGYKKAVEVSFLARLKRRKNTDRESGKIILLTPDDWMDCEDIIETIQQGNLLPADFKKFLLFDKENQWLRSKTNLVTFGLVLENELGDLVVPSINKDSGEMPELWLCNEPWSERCSFVATSLN